MHKTTILCQFGSFVTSLPNHISINSQPFLVGIVSFHAGPREPELVAVLVVLGQEYVNHRDDGDCGADGKAVVLVVHQPHHLFSFSARQIGFVVCYLHLQFILPRFLVAQSKLRGFEAFQWELCSLLLPTILSIVVGLLDFFIGENRHVAW